LSALLESLVYNRKRPARSYNICRSGDIVSRSIAIEMNGYTCYSPHRVLFRASFDDRTELVGLSLSLLSSPSVPPSHPSSRFPCLPPIEGRRTPYPVLPSSVVTVLCVSEAEETRREDPRSGVVKIRRAATPGYWPTFARAPGGGIVGESRKSLAEDRSRKMSPYACPFD